MFRSGQGSKFHALVHSARATFEIDAIDEATQSGWSVSGWQHDLRVPGTSTSLIASRALRP